MGPYDLIRSHPVAEQRSKGHMLLGSEFLLCQLWPSDHLVGHSQKLLNKHKDQAVQKPPFHCQKMLYSNCVLTAASLASSEILRDQQNPWKRAEWRHFIKLPHQNCFSEFSLWRQKQIVVSWSVTNGCLYWTFHEFCRWQERSASRWIGIYALCYGLAKGWHLWSCFHHLNHSHILGHF